MGYYNVLEPCVVGKLHYATVPSQPIEVDDEVAAPLVEAGYLKPYPPGVQSIKADLEGAFGAINAIALADPVEDPEKPAPRPRGRRKVDED